MSINAIAGSPKGAAGALDILRPRIAVSFGLAAMLTAAAAADAGPGAA